MRDRGGEKGQLTESLIGHKEFVFILYYLCYGNPLQNFKQGSDLIYALKRSLCLLCKDEL